MEKKREIIRKIAAIAAAAVMMVCIFAQPVLAATSDSDVEKHKHTYTSFETVREPGIFIQLGIIKRECTECGHVQTLYTPSPLLGIVLAVLALIVIVGLVSLLSALAKKFRKSFKTLLAILVGLCLLILLIGAGAHSIMVGGKFGANLVRGLVELLGGKGFYATKATDCIFMMFGKTACMIINGLFYVALITIIFTVIALVKATVAGVKKGAKAVGDTIGDATDKLLGKND